MNNDISKALLSYALLLATAFYSSIVLGWGAAESSRELSSLWYYLRRGLLVAAALVASGDTITTFLSKLGWKTTVRFIGIAAGSGLFLGFFNKGGFDPRLPETLPLALFHTFSMELYFRAYLFKALERGLKTTRTALLLSSLLYALYYQTMWTCWIQPIAGKVAMFFMFSFLGILFSYSYKKSGSFLVNWIMHIFTGLQFRLLLP